MSLPLKDKIRCFRQDQGLTLESFAKLLGVSSVSVWRWENGESKPKSGRFDNLFSAWREPHECRRRGAK